MISLSTNSGTTFPLISSPMNSNLEPGLDTISMSMLMSLMADPGRSLRKTPSGSKAFSSAFPIIWPSADLTSNLSVDISLSGLWSLACFASMAVRKASMSPPCLPPYMDWLLPGLEKYACGSGGIDPPGVVVPEHIFIAGIRNSEGSLDLDLCRSNGVGLSWRTGVLARTWLISKSSKSLSSNLRATMSLLITNSRSFVSA